MYLSIESIGEVPFRALTKSKFSVVQIACDKYWFRATLGRWIYGCTQIGRVAPVDGERFCSCRGRDSVDIDLLVGDERSHRPLQVHRLSEVEVNFISVGFQFREDFEARRGQLGSQVRSPLSTQLAMRRRTKKWLSPK